MGNIYSYKKYENKEKMNGTYYKNIYPDAKEILKNKDKGVFREFINICKMTQNELKAYLNNMLKQLYTEVINKDGFLYAKGDIPVLLTAHMDTVHKEQIRKYYIITRKDGSHVITSPQGIGGDDRCGIYMILKVLKSGFRPYILFCEDEEKGGIGSDKFVATEYVKDLEELKYMIELDRANENDAVFYDCDNVEFSKYILDETKYVESWGTFSDISTLAPVSGVAAVNLSCGYYNAHTVKEEVVYEEMMETERIVEELLSSVDKCKQFEYVDALDYFSQNKNVKSYYTYSSSKGNNIASINKVACAYDEDCDGVLLHVLYEDRNGGAVEEYSYADTEGDAWKEFFMSNPFVCWADILDFEYDRF